MKGGDKVIVLDNCKYHGLCYNHIGVVKANYTGYNKLYNTVPVQILDMENPNSAEGIFYFTAKSLKVIDNKGETNMNTKITGDYFIVEIAFLDGTNKDRTYRYACFDETVVEGDYCVVMSANHGLGIGQVRSIGPRDNSEEIYREVVAKFDMSDYFKRVDTRKKTAEIRREMKKRAEALQDIMLYETLAKGDSEMAKLLESYKQLQEN